MLDPMLIETKEKKRFYHSECFLTSRVLSKVSIPFILSDPILLALPHLFKEVEIGLPGNPHSLSPSITTSRPISLVPRSPNSNDPSRSKQIPVGRCLQFFADKWDLNTLDKWIGGTISHRYSLKFPSLPWDRFLQVRRPCCKIKYANSCYWTAGAAWGHKNLILSSGILDWKCVPISWQSWRSLETPEQSLTWWLNR